MELVYHILIITFNTIFFVFSFILIIKRRKHPAISVRSPVLLFLNNFGGFLMTNIFLIYELLEDFYKDDYNNEIKFELRNDNQFNLFCKIFPNNYLIAHFLMIFSFILRCQRILACCKINNDERTEIQLFYKNRYKFKERYYIKILFFLMCIVTFINFLLNLQFENLILVPYHFEKCINNDNKSFQLENIIGKSDFFRENDRWFSDLNQSYLNSIEWIVINFIEHIILVTYSYFLSVNPIKQLIKLELNMFFCIWIIYPNFLRFSQFFIQNNDPYTIDNSHWTSYACVFFLYLCLIINGYIPIITSYLEEKKLNYHFIPKLANNLYLFLSNEICFDSFFDYILNSESEIIENYSINSRSPLEENNQDLNNSTDKGTFFLRLYTDIMKFKLSYSIEPDDNKVIGNARKVYDYFNGRNSENQKNKLDKYFEVDILNKTKSRCQILNQDKFDYEMFDDALAITFKNLYEIFSIYKKSEEFQILIDNLTLNSYIHCKMYNTGLINKF